MNRLRRSAALGCVGLVCLTSAGFPSIASATEASSFSKTVKISRAHLIGGADQVVDTRTVTVDVSQTQNLRDRQAVTVSWKGAHPTGGLVNDHNAPEAALQEYPVLVMQCRGVDSTTVPAGRQVQPQTCWTLTPSERYQYSQTGSNFPAYRMDRYAATADRAAVVNQPTPLPDGCPDPPAPHWVPFLAASGTVYPGGNLGCAGVAPEAANSADQLQPGNTTYGVADQHGDGSTKFVMQSADTNASLGCSATVPCTLEVIPIMGVSCDAAGTAAAPGGMPAADRPPAKSVEAVFQGCSPKGHFQPGEFNGGGVSPDLPVVGALWWTASNWRNRIPVALTFAPSASVCDVVNNSATAYVYGAEGMVQATQQWAPSFCLNPSLFILRHVQTSEPQAKNLLASGNIQAAFQAGPPPGPFRTPTVQAPAAITGFAVAYSVDGADGAPYPNLRLNARLLAKLLAESYRGCGGDCLDFTSAQSQRSGFAALKNNPIDMSRDPEFKALNPGIPATNNLQAAATLAVMASDADLMTALTSYLNADPEARAWLDGTADPWGMLVNPAYKHIVLPVANWPLLDTHVVALGAGANQCLDANPVPWLPLVAAPVSNPATVALNLQFDIANSQVNCKNNGAQNQKLSGLGRQPPGSRFLIGLVSLGDATRYQLNNAALQTHNTSTGTGPFADATGRSFAAPTDAALRAAAALLKPDDSLGTWPVPYNTLRTDSRGAAAYPGTVLMSVDVPTRGLPRADANRYAQFLRFVAGPGQTQGLGNGQLPPGYLPLSADNGLAAFAAYTRLAAEAVAAQRGAFPLVSGRSVPPSTTPRTASSTPPNHGSSPAAGTQRPPAAPGGAGGGAGRSGEPSATTTPKPGAASAPNGAGASSDIAAAAVGKTSSLGPGVLGLALPALALMALVALGGSAWTSRFGRR